MMTLYSKAKALVRPLYNAILWIILAPIRNLNRDITIRHHYTQHSFRLHSKAHYRYYAEGARRERTSMELFAKLIKLGDVVVDVGGHTGYFADYFSHLVGKQGRVIVFEPGPNNLPYLRQNTADQSNITVIEKAVGFSEGDFPFYMDISQNGELSTLSQDWNESQYKFYKKQGLNLIYQTIMVPVVRLDSMLQTIPTVNFIKIDVEGAEVDVLNGGRELIQQHHPMLMVSCHDTAQALWDVLNGAGYWVFTPEKKRIYDASFIKKVLFTPTLARRSLASPLWHCGVVMTNLSNRIYLSASFGSRRGNASRGNRYQ